MTPAQELREAARLMRERAEASENEVMSPWYPRIGLHVVGANGSDVACWDCCRLDPSRREATQAHIASWHPAVALAVADWLEAEADHVDRGANSVTFDGAPMFPPSEPALAVARAYLGTTS